MSEHLSVSPNSFSALGLIAIIPLSILAFALLKPTRAVLVVTFVPILFMPERVSFDAPLLPPLNKVSLASLCLLIGVLATGRDRLREAKPGRGIDILIILALLATIGTTLTNGDPLQYGPTALPGITTSDLISTVSAAVLGPLIPFFVGRVMFRRTEDAHDLLRAFAIAGLVYIPFILIEVRLSPQLHNWVYGFHAHSFVQTRRWGGFRPTVFMVHGLAVAELMFSAVFSAWALRKAGVPLFRKPSLSPSLILSVMIPVVKSAGALVYSIVMIPIIWFTKPKTQARISTVLVLIALLYPLMRTTDWFPRQDITDFAARFSQERAASLDFRFENEEILLIKALERPIFGWGGWARNRVYDENGLNVAIPDGAWVVIIGMTGIVGFLCYFGLLVIPVLNTLRRIGEVAVANQGPLAALCLLSACYTVDLVPNAGYAQMPIFLAGVVAGLAQGMAEEKTTRFDPKLAVRVLEALRRLQSGVPRRLGAPSK